VAALGPGVSDFKVGDKVVGALQRIGGGAYAEYALALDSVLSLKPKAFTFEQAAGIPTAGFSGLRMVLRADVKKGERVLVIGAAGGVGSTAVQVARAQGAYVIGSADSRHNAYLKSIGVNQIVNYDKEKVGDKVKNVDVVINTAETENATAPGYAKRGGRVVSIAGQPDDAACAAAGVSCFSGGPGWGPADGDLLRQLVQMANSGTYKVQVEKSFPLSALNDAYAYGRSGNRQGKLVLDVRPEATQR
jgi:NADPH:quinone reductase-like Zn-dependent oxidoreductase